MIKKHEAITGTSPILIYANKIKNRIVFKIKSRYKLELLSKEALQLLGSLSNAIDSDKNSELVPKLGIVDVVLVHCNLLNNNYQQTAKVLFTLVHDKQFGQLMIIKPHSPTVLKTTNAKFSFIKVWFTDQDNKPLDIEDNVNVTLTIGVN